MERIMINDVEFTVDELLLQNYVCAVYVCDDKLCIEDGGANMEETEDTPENREKYIEKAEEYLQQSIDDGSLKETLSKKILELKEDLEMNGVNIDDLVCEKYNVMDGQVDDEGDINIDGTWLKDADKAGIHRMG